MVGSGGGLSQDKGEPIGERDRAGRGGRAEELKESLLSGIGAQAGTAAEAEARSLLDQVLGQACEACPDDTEAFIDQLVVRSLPFVRGTHDMEVRHRRLMGVSHVLVNILRPIAEENEDELISSRFEVLRDRLFNLERVDGKSSAVDHRLVSIYEGLVELTSVLCMTSCKPIEG
jgi:hypothetical protein